MAMNRKELSATNDLAAHVNDLWGNVHLARRASDLDRSVDLADLKPLLARRPSGGAGRSGETTSGADRVVLAQEIEPRDAIGADR